jgi:hypothetical protein
MPQEVALPEQRYRSFQPTFPSSPSTSHQRANAPPGKRIFSAVQDPDDQRPNTQSFVTVRKVWLAARSKFGLPHRNVAKQRPINGRTPPQENESFRPFRIWTIDTLTPSFPNRPKSLACRQIKVRLPHHIISANASTQSRSAAESKAANSYCSCACCSSASRSI